MKATRVEGINELHGDNGTNGGYCPITIDGKKTWMIRTPNGHAGNLSAHDVTEHEDGSITVSPSILISDNSGELYHGFLRHGIWDPGSESA